MNLSNERKEGKTKTFTQIVEVIPIHKGLPKPTLSYFTSEKLQPGNIIKIPIRNSATFGIVQKTYSAREIKSDLKNSSFSLRKLGKIGKVMSLPPAYIKAVIKTSEYYAVTLSEVLFASLPKIFLENLDFVTTSFSSKSPSVLEPILIQLEKDDRYGRYKGVVREAFARKKSVMLFVPNHEDAIRMYKELSNGIEEFTFVFSLTLPKKKLLTSLLRAHDINHPILFITTPTGSAFHRRDWGTFIIERENSKGFTTQNRPFISFKKFIEYLATYSGAELVEGDSVLSLEALLRERSGLSRELFPLKWRLTTDSRTTIIDMKKVTDKDGNLVILSHELRELIEKAKDNEERILLFGARKGLSPTTVCGDCGHVLSCKNCGAPVVLYEKDGVRIYVCHVCKAKRASETRCDNCESWKLRALGIGIDLIAIEVKRLYPDAHIYIMDKDHCPTRAKAEAQLKKILSDRTAVVIGTELALMHLTKVPYAGVVSLDTLFGIPDFGINERIFYLVSTIREMTKKEVVLQTRNVGKEILTLSANGNISDFYRKEVEERRELNYPPYSLFVKVVTTGTTEALERRVKYLNEHFKEFNPEYIKNKNLKSGSASVNMIIRKKRDLWPDLSLTSKLALLTPEFLIKVDPESII